MTKPPKFWAFQKEWSETIGTLPRRDSSRKLNNKMWFEIAIMAIFLLLGHIIFGHFEEKAPRWRKLLKAALTIAVFPTISYFFGRFWFWIALLIAAIPPLIIHVWWLPKQGINGWTGEPKKKYYELRGWKIDETP